MLALRILQLMVCSVFVIPNFLNHVVKERIIRGSDPFFRLATREKREFFLARKPNVGVGEGKAKEDDGGTFRVDGGGSAWCAGQEAG